MRTPGAGRSSFVPTERRPNDAARHGRSWSLPLRRVPPKHGPLTRAGRVKPTVLLLSTATRWLGTARMPRVLARAGFEVALLTPPDSLAEKSRYVSRIGHISSTAIPMEWLFALLQFVKAVSPQMLVPCDEMAIRLLFALILDPPRGLDSELKARIVSMVTDSLGDPRFYAVSIDKTMLPAAAEAMGVRVPPYGIAASVNEAIERATVLGYPAVLKRRFGFAGQGVEIVSNRDEVIAAAQRLLQPDQLDLGELKRPQLLVQKFIAGPHYSQALVALRGVPLDSFAWERMAGTRPIKGQTTVLRFVRSPETREFSERLCREFAMSGFFNVQFIIDERTGEAHMLEINRRLVTHMHLGERVGRDLGQALFAALGGQPTPRGSVEGENEGGAVVVFPREWLRDPQSPHLSEFPVDVPWDEPELVEAMLAMRHEA